MFIIAHVYFANVESNSLFMKILIQKFSLIEFITYLFLHFQNSSYSRFIERSLFENGTINSKVILDRLSQWVDARRYQINWPQHDFLAAFTRLIMIFELSCSIT